MHTYTLKNETFYADLSDLLLLVSIGLTNPDRELAAGLTEGTYLSDVMACADGVIAGLQAPASNASASCSPAGCSGCRCGDSGCGSSCSDDTGKVASIGHLLDALTECADACLHDDTEEVYTRINREFNRLFINPRNELVSLYESILVHPEEKKATMFINATCMHAEQTYRHTGFAFDEKNKVPGDHVAIELRYLAYLFASYLNAVQAANEASCKAVEAAVEDFCHQHVQRWLGRFIDQVRANSNDPFYLLMAQVLEFVEPVLLG